MQPDRDIGYGDTRLGPPSLIYYRFSYLPDSCLIPQFIWLDVSRKVRLLGSHSIQEANLSRAVCKFANANSSRSLGAESIVRTHKCDSSLPVAINSFHQVRYELLSKKLPNKLSLYSHYSCSLTHILLYAHSTVLYKSLEDVRSTIFLYFTRQSHIDNL